MQVMYERRCGIDVHQQTVVACAIVPDAEGQGHKETRTFATLTEDLEVLAGWLSALGVTHVAMESTGVYWKPVFNVLVGRLKPHHRFLLAQHLSHIDFLDEAIAHLDAQIEAQLRPFQATLDRWDSLPGINRRLAEIIVVEIGIDLQPFEDAEHRAAWAGMCPGSNESAGKRHSGETRKGSKWLRRALIGTAHGAARTKNKYYQALYQRLAARRGKRRAAVAVGHSLLVTGYT